MNVAILIVEGNDDDLDAIVDILPFPYDARWGKGELRQNGESYESSGVSVTVADEENPIALVRCILEFLKRCKAKGAIFSAHNLVAELSVGFTVGDSKQFVASVEFSSAELLMFAECGIAISITAYPTSDEVNAEQNAT